MKIKIFALLLVALAVTFVCAAFNLEPGIGTGIIATSIFIAGVEYKSLPELQEARNKIIDEMKGLIDKASNEKRSMSAEENTKYDELKLRIKDFDREIQRMEDVERMFRNRAEETGKKSNEEKRKEEMTRFSMRKAIQYIIQGKEQDGIEKEMHDEAVKEGRGIGKEITGFGIPSILQVPLSIHSRAASATGGSSGSEGGVLVPNMTIGFIELLVNKLLMKSLGITTMTGMTANFDIPKVTSGMSAGWETENGQGDETSGGFGKVSFTPRRLAAWTKISKQLIMQAAYSVETLLQTELIRAIDIAVDKAIISGAGSGSNQPEGILSTTGIGSVAIGTNGGAPTYDHIVALEREVAIDNADLGALAFLTNSKVRSKLKTTKLDAGSGLFVWDAKENNMLQGYMAAVTNQVVSNLTKGEGTGLSPIIFGNFADYILAQFGALDVVVDPYTLAAENQIKLTVNSYWDGHARHAESFAAILDATT